MCLWFGNASIANVLENKMLDFSFFKLDDIGRFDVLGM